MLTGVVVFLLLLICLLAIPVTLTFQTSWPQAVQGYIKLQWAFGLVNVRLPSFQSKVPVTAGEAKPQKTKHLEPSSRKNKNIFALIRQTSFRRRVIRFVTDLWHAFHKRDVMLRIRIGLGDPADTGQLWALVGPVAGILANSKDVSFEIEPEFFDSTFELNSSGNIRFIPLQIIYLTIAMLLSPSVWQGIKQMRQVV